MNNRNLCIAAMVGLCLAFLPAVSQGNMIVNGSFEAGNCPSPFGTLNAVDSTTLAGWTVAGGSVDWINGYWQSADGSKSIDMDGNNPGKLSLSQSLSTTKGMTYELTFAMSGNPDGAPKTKTLEVIIDGVQHNFTYETGANTLADMKWATKSLRFVAAGEAVAIEFISPTTDTAYGAALDNVSVVPVPVPAAIVLGAMGLGLVGWTKRRMVKSN